MSFCVIFCVVNNSVQNSLRGGGGGLKVESNSVIFYNFTYQ